jgi:hypothetical protein
MDTTPLTFQVPNGTKAAYAAWLTANASALAFHTSKPVWIDDGPDPAALHLGGRTAAQIETVVTAVKLAGLFAGAGTVATPYVIPVAGVNLSVSSNMVNLYEKVAGVFAPEYLSLDLSACLVDTTGANAGAITGVDTDTLSEAIRDRFVAITLPNTVTNLAFNAKGTFDSFHNLNSITAVGVTTIGNYAFLYCTALSEVRLGATAPALGNYIFQNTGSSRTITIAFPAGSSVAADWVTTNAAAHWGTTNLATIVQGTY